MAGQRAPQLLMASAAGVAAANIYYNQAMLADIARTFQVNAAQAGLVATASQIGYGLGIGLFVPLGDLLPRRALLMSMFLLTGAALVLGASSASLPWLLFASGLVGLSCPVAQILVPLASDLTTPDRAGRTVGSILSGLLIGILLARSVSGVVSAHLGWRAMYWIAAGLALWFAMLLRWRLPHLPRKSSTSYGALVRSTAALVRDTPELRRTAWIAALFFASFSAFWTTLVFFLETPPYHYGSQVAGLFGLIGAVSAAIAPVAGHLSDRRSPQYVVRLSGLAVLTGYALFAGLGTHLWALIAGVILLDAGVQAAQVANQTTVMSLHPEARSRVNTFYMLCYFGGGSLGSMMAGYLWSSLGWPGVCAAGAGCIVLAMMAVRRRHTAAFEYSSDPAGKR